MLKHDEKSMLKVFSLDTDDVDEFLREFITSTNRKKKVSYAMEDILIKLNELEGQEKKKYWNCLLFFAIRGLNNTADELSVHAENITDIVKEFMSEKQKD